MDYNPLHRAVDRLRPDEAEALLVIVTSMLGQSAEAEPADVPSAVPESAQPRLPFTAAGSWASGSRR